MIYLRGPHLGPVGTAWRITGRKRGNGKVPRMIALVMFLTWPLVIGWAAEAFWLPVAIILLGVGARASGKR